MASGRLKLSSLSEDQAAMAQAVATQDDVPKDVQMLVAVLEVGGSHSRNGDSTIVYIYGL